MKKWGLFFLLGIMTVVLISCKGQKVEVKNDTPMAAAKTLVKGMITGNPAYFQNLIYISSISPKPKQVVAIAKHRNIVGMEMSQFHFKKVPKHKDTIIVNFKDSDGDQDQWKLVFTKDQKGYKLFSRLSSPLVNNDTPLQAAKVLLRSVTENKPYLTAQLIYPNRYHVSGDSIIKAANMVGVKMNQVKLEVSDRTRTSDGKGVRTVIVTYQTPKGKAQKKNFNFLNNYSYGYSYESIRIVDSTREKKNTPESNAHKLIYNLLAENPQGVMKLLNRPSCQKVYGLSKGAKKSGLLGMKGKKAQQIQYEKGNANSIFIQFKNPKGKKIRWRLYFVGDDNKLDHTNIPLPDSGKASQMANGSAMEAAKSLVQGMIGQNADEVTQVIGKNPCWNAIHFLDANQENDVNPKGLKGADFHKGKAPNTIEVTMKNKKGQTVNWTLLFQKETSGGYKLIGSNLTPYSALKDLLHFIKADNQEMMNVLSSSDVSQNAVTQLLKQKNHLKNAKIKGRDGAPTYEVHFKAEGKQFTWVFYFKKKDAAYVINKIDLHPEE